METEAIIDALVSHAMTTADFEAVNQHEPKNAPGNGLTAAIWVQSISPTRSNGLSSTSIRMAFTVRLFSNMLQEPQDMIDPNLVKALDKLLALYSGDFTLDGLVRNVDLLGAHGAPLGAQAGYVNLSGTHFRIFDINVPVILNDVWTQEP
jgi:hypothetical protein